MTELQQIQQKAEELSLEFLLIGGLAVIEYGFTRVTTDIDLVVRSRSRDSWKEMLAGIGFALINEKDNFQQMRGPA